MHPIWAVAQTFFREVTRSLGFRLFFPMLLLVGAVLPGVVSGEDLLGRLRLLVSYGLGIPAVLISLVTLVYSTGSLSRDVDRRFVYLVATKPLRPAQILLGKLLGVVVLDAALLLSVLLVFSVNVWFLTIGQPVRQQEAAQQQFFVARLGVFPGLDETTKVPPGHESALTFRGLPDSRSSGERLLIRFKIYASPYETIQVDTRWRCVGTGGEAVRARRITQSTHHLLEVPSTLVGENGLLTIFLRNDEAADSGVHLLVPPESVEVLFVYGGFAANVGRVALVLMGHFTFLAVLGLLGAALFSLATANLLAFLVYIAGTVSGYLKESLRVFDSFGQFGLLVAGVGERFLELVPDFSGENPLDLLVDGRAIAVSALLAGLGWTLVVRSGVVFLFTAWCWSRREVGGRQT